MCIVPDSISKLKISRLPISAAIHITSALICNGQKGYGSIQIFRALVLSRVCSTAKLMNFEYRMSLLQRIQSLGVKVVFICPDNSPKYTGRKFTMLWMLQSIGFTNIEHFKSDDIPYPRCLVKATLDILKKYIDEPVIVLEDDVAYTDQCMFEIPEDTDAFYLGLSECAAHTTREHNDGISQFEYKSPHTVRVKNMLSAHAVYYKTRRYKEAVIELMERAFMMNYTNDVSFTRLQPLYNIYAGVNPMFYQSRTFNLTNHIGINVEDQTNIQILISEDKQCVPLRRYGGKSVFTKYIHEIKDAKC